MLAHFHWPWLWLGVRRSAQTKLLGFIFSHTFQLIMMKFTMMLKQLKLNILTLLIDIDWNKVCNWLCFIWTLRCFLQCLLCKYYLQNVQAILMAWTVFQTAPVTKTTQCPVAPPMEPVCVNPAGKDTTAVKISMSARQCPVCLINMPPATTLLAAMIVNVMLATLKTQLTIAQVQFDS